MRSRRHSFTSETELARKVVAWLNYQHWEVYQEVDIGGGVADIVTVQGYVTWIIECKLSTSLALMEQASNWVGTANYVSVAVPWSRRNSFTEKVLKWLGVGVLRVSSYDKPWSCSVEENVPPRLFRKTKDDVRRHLMEAQKTYAEAGNNRGHRWSPWKQTCDNVLRYVLDNPGCNMKELVQNINTHYGTTSTARSCIKHWAECNRIPGVRLAREGNLLKFYPTE